MTHDIVVNLSIDFDLLREQKDELLLIALKTPHVGMAEGILSLLDAIQDQAVEQGVPEATVFPKINEWDWL